MAVCYDSTGTRCSSRCQPGASNLLRAVLALFSECRSLGCFNCRSVRGGSSLSTHGEGRGIDPGFPGVRHSQGTSLFLVLHDVYPDLGVQRAIWSRQQWDARNPSIRYYSGQAAHWDHVHAELCWDAARNLSYDHAYRTLARALGQPTKPPVTPTPMEPSLDPYIYIPVLEAA